MSRPSTGKRLRFEVFKRDGFTCRYCGAQPPEVVLVVDHVIPVAEGGLSRLDNLITACESCNQGKAAKRVSEAAPRIDADEHYLEARQEIAEMRRYQESLAELDEERTRLIGALLRRFARETDISQYALAKLAPAVRSLLLRYEMEIVGVALDAVAARIAAGRLTRSSEEFVPYLWGVAKNIARQSEGDT